MKRAPFYLELPDDEVPYSTLVRYSLLSAFKLHQVCQQIYGNSRKRIHPYVPAEVARFSTFFALDEFEVLRNRTLFPLLQFVQPANIEELRERALFQRDSALFSKTVFAHSKISTFYGLKHCPLCIEEELNRQGFCYWHIAHQLPGIEVCHRHGCYLHGVAMGDGAKDRALLYPESCIDKSAHDATEIQFRLAKFAVELLQLLKEQPIDYRHSYSSLLVDKGLIRGQGRLSLQCITCEMKAYWEGISFGNELGFPVELSSFAFLGPLLRDQTHFPQHPCKHLLLAGWLTGCDAKLLTQPLCIAQPEKELNQHAFLEDQILNLANENMSMLQIMQSTGKSKCYVKRVIESAGLKHRTNSMAIPTAVRRSIVLKAIVGKHRQSIAQDLGIGIGVVEQVISNTYGLADWRRHLSKRKRVQDAYVRLSKLVTLHPDWSRLQIRQADESAYFCLYNNDKNLLERVLPSPMLATPPEKDWELEDQALLEKIKGLGCIKGFSLAKIGRLVKDKGYLSRYLEKLPLTRAYLTDDFFR